jgi:hypothetical protein
MASQITRSDLKRIVLARLDEWIRNLGPAEAQLPRMIVGGRPMSPLDLKREVQMETPLGVEFMSGEARKLGFVVVG